MTEPDGAPSARNRLTKLAPWLTSAAIHAAVIAVILSVGAVAVSVSQSRTEVAGPVQARWVELPEAKSTQPVVPPAPGPSNSSVAASPAFHALTPLPLGGSGIAPARRGAVPASGSAYTSGVTFAGISAPQARRIAFVLDASGSMVGSFPAVAAECRRAVESLGPGGEFVVLVFQGGDSRVAALGKLQAASTDAAARTADWLLREIRPGGSSDPRGALERALSFHPDTLFLLANGDAAGSSFGIGRAALLAAVETANAPDRFTGQRDCVVNCVECFERDPEGALEALATAHGGSYRYASRADLGLTRQTRSSP